MPDAALMTAASLRAYLDIGAVNSLPAFLARNPSFPAKDPTTCRWNRRQVDIWLENHFGLTQHGDRDAMMEAAGGQNVDAIRQDGAQA